MAILPTQPRPMALNAHALKVALEQYERGTHYKKGAVQRRLRKQRKQKLAQDIASFTHAKPAKEKFLRQSQTWGISAVTPELRAIMRGTLAGQDYSLVLHPVPGDVRQTMSLVLDGHGEDGELFAVHGGEYLAKQLEIVWDQVRSACYSNDDSQVTEICKMAFQETEQYLGRTLGGNSGGSTATVAMIVDGTYIVTANVGDSPALLCFENGTHRMLTASHSADSAEEYTRYRARCAHAGVTPAEFVFNRFNCPGGHRMAGPNGEYAPLAIFTLYQNNQAVPIEDNLRYVDTLGHHGGIQSVRKHVHGEGQHRQGHCDPTRDASHELGQHRGRAATKHPHAGGLGRQGAAVPRRRAQREHDPDRPLCRHHMAHGGQRRGRRCTLVRGDQHEDGGAGSGWCGHGTSTV